MKKWNLLIAGILFASLGCAQAPQTEPAAEALPEATTETTSEPEATPEIVIRSLNTSGAWLSFYGTPEQMGDLSQIATDYATISIDADPDRGFTPEQIETLKQGGKNSVLSYLDLSACDPSLSYWNTAPDFVSCEPNQAALMGLRVDAAERVWINPADASFQNLIVNLVAPRLAATGVDGFVMNLEIISCI